MRRGELLVLVVAAAALAGCASPPDAQPDVYVPAARPGETVAYYQVSSAGQAIDSYSASIGATKTFWNGTDWQHYRQLVQGPDSASWIDHVGRRALAESILVDDYGSNHQIERVEDFDPESAARVVARVVASGGGPMTEALMDAWFGGPPQWTPDGPLRIQVLETHILVEQRNDSAGPNGSLAEGHRRLAVLEPGSPFPLELREGLFWGETTVGSRYVRVAVDQSENASTPLPRPGWRPNAVPGTHPMLDGTTGELVLQALQGVQSLAPLIGWSEPHAELAGFFVSPEYYGPTQQHTVELVLASPGGKGLAVKWTIAGEQWTPKWRALDVEPYDPPAAPFISIGDAERLWRVQKPSLDDREPHRVEWGWSIDWSSDAVEPWVRAREGKQITVGTFDLEGLTVWMRDGMIAGAPQHWGGSTATFMAHDGALLRVGHWAAEYERIETDLLAPEDPADPYQNEAGPEFDIPPPARAVSWATVAGVALTTLVLALLGRIPFVGLYARVQGRRLLNHPMRAWIWNVVKQAPGITLPEIVRLTGTPESTLRHHVRVLVAARLIATTRVQGRRHFFPAEAESASERQAVALARNPTRMRIIELVREHPGARTADLAVSLGVSMTTIRKQAALLIDAGLIQTRHHQGRMLFYPA